MITTEQEKQITEYLHSKKLSSGLLLEIKDHFILQIESIMSESGLGFQEALLQTKLKWQPELEMVKADVLSFKKITRIEKNMLRVRFRNIILSSVIVSGLLGLLMKQDVFIYTQILLFVVVAGLLLYNFIFKKLKLIDYLQLSFHPLILRNTFLAILLYSSLALFYKFDFWGTEIFRLFFLYAVITQIQLLYFNTKKINVLI